MALPRDVEKVLSNVAATHELPSFGRNQLFDFWEAAFGSYFEGFESSSARFQSSVREQTESLANRWVVVWTVHRNFFETIDKLNLEAIEKFNKFLLTPPTTADSGGVWFSNMYEPQGKTSPNDVFFPEYRRLAMQLIGTSDPSYRDDDEDEKARVLLNEISDTLNQVSQDLATSNARIERALAKIDSADARD